MTPENCVPYIGYAGRVYNRCKACDEISRNKRRPLKKAERDSGDLRRCKRCEIWKTREEHFAKSGISGYRHECKTCRNITGRTSDRKRRREERRLVPFFLGRIEFAISNGFEIQEVAAALGVATNTVSNWHNKKATPRVSSIRKHTPKLLALPMFQETRD